jgi:hypothetical protein
MNNNGGPMLLVIEIIHLAFSYCRSVKRHRRPSYLLVINVIQHTDPSNNAWKLHHLCLWAARVRCCAGRPAATKWRFMWLKPVKVIIEALSNAMFRVELKWTSYRNYSYIWKMRMH